MEKKEYTKDQKKAILIYSGELALFAIIFAILGILILLEVIGVKDWKKYAFTFVTLIGGLWPIADFIWSLASKKHREKGSMIDKCFLLPVPLCLIPLDIWILVQGIDNVNPDVFRFGISIPLLYFSLVYVFEAIYHYFKPLPLLLEEEEEKKGASQDNQVNDNENDEE